MGYRHYFYLADKDECEAIKNMNYDEFFAHCKENHPKSIEDFDDEVWINFHDALEQKEIFEFGKLYWDDTADRIYSKGEPLFANKDVQDSFSDYQPYRMDRDGMLEAIKIYKEKVVKFYESLLADEVNKNVPFYELSVTPENLKQPLWELCHHVEDVLRWWKYNGVVDISADTMKIAGSWLYEHQIFQLAHLLKVIDWDKKCLLFYGW